MEKGLCKTMRSFTYSLSYEVVGGKEKWSITLNVWLVADLRPRNYQNAQSK